MNRRLMNLALMVSIVTFGLNGAATAQQPKPDLRIDAATRVSVIDAVLDTLDRRYVFPEVAKKVASAIRDRQKRGEYDNLTLGPAFAEVLTLHVQEVTGDRHIRIGYSAEPLPERQNRSEPSAEEIEEYRLQSRRLNHGFERLERLQGNVGYIDLRGFYDANLAAETATHAMSFLANTDVLIFDLRKNGGGDPAMVALLCTYLFGDEPVHLNDLYFREENRTTEFWTLPYVPGPKYGNKPVYVLTSRRTFSGAEEFANNLKTLKRATIVGEATGGGANPGGGERLGPHFRMFVPTGRAINPITKSNWEGPGVEPDVKVPAGYALEWAYHDAITKIVEGAKGTPRARDLEEVLQEAAKKLEDAKANTKPETPPSLTGNTEFRLKGAAFARRVAIAGSFNDWNPDVTLFAREGDGWVCRVELPPGKHTYKLVVDGRMLIDPANPNFEDDGGGRVNSVINR